MHKGLTIGDSGSWIIKALLNLTKEQDGDDCSVIEITYLEFIYIVQKLVMKNINILLKTCKNSVLENLKGPKALIEYSNNMHDVYKNIEKYNSGKKCNVLIAFDDMIAGKSKT